MAGFRPLATLGPAFRLRDTPLGLPLASSRRPWLILGFSFGPDYRTARSAGICCPNWLPPYGRLVGIEKRPTLALGELSDRKTIAVLGSSR